ncbi:MAG: type I-E CRISPR-associated protein Cas6/Cse3/CasE [Oscillospiraceae bacterium]|nr:type I-E CRISPR-associated protein Cas6/Cse3/CasE [Oscillospiraceae bacterium]
MYISRIELDATRRETLRALASPSVLHGALERCFDGERRHPLWRIDMLCGKVYLLIVSAVPPNLLSIKRQFCLPESAGETRDYTPVLTRIHEDDAMRFRLLANPVHRFIENGVKKIVAHQTPEHQRGWLRSKAQKCGFSLQDGAFDAVSEGWKRFRKADGSFVEIKTVAFEGVLTVTDATILRDALTDGIGRAKAYGCGLLTLARGNANEQ